MFILKCKVDETNELNEIFIPKQIFYHILDVYENSSKGFHITSMSYLLYDFESVKHIVNEKNPPRTAHENDCNSLVNQMKLNENILFDNKQNVGFLYFKPTSHHYQCCLKQLKEHFTASNFLISYLIQKWEISWAKLFPLRLYLRLGEEFNSK